VNEPPGIVFLDLQHVKKIDESCPGKGEGSTGGHDQKKVGQTSHPVAPSRVPQRNALTTAFTNAGLSK